MSVDFTALDLETLVQLELRELRPQGTRTHARNEGMSYGEFPEMIGHDGEARMRKHVETMRTSP